MTTQRTATQPTSPAAPAGTPRQERRVALASTTVTEADLFASYFRGRQAADIGSAVLSRIATLWEYREWYRSHLGWIPQSRTEHMTELRLLVRLARSTRHRHQYIGVPDALIGDPRTGYLADVEVCNCGSTRTPRR